MSSAFFRQALNLLGHPRSALVPIFGQRRHSIHLIGSGVLIRFDFSTVILTSARIKNFIECYSLLIPGNESEVDLIGCLETGRLPNPACINQIDDLAYFRLDSTVRREMHPDRFLPLDHRAVDAFGITRQGDRYSVIGYPRTPGEMEPQIEYPETVAMTCEGVSKNVYRRMRFSSEDYLILRPRKKNEHDYLPLYGSPQIWPYSLSGGGVFAWDEETGSLQEPRPPKLVAIVTKFHPEAGVFTAVRLHHYLDQITENYRFGVF